MIDKPENRQQNVKLFLRSPLNNGASEQPLMHPFVDALAHE
jgi:hypothetical protein